MLATIVSFRQVDGVARRHAARSCPIPQQVSGDQGLSDQVILRQHRTVTSRVLPPACATDRRDWSPFCRHRSDGGLLSRTPNWPGGGALIASGVLGTSVRTTGNLDATHGPCGARSRRV
jgi:hypothetical protein